MVIEEFPNPRHTTSEGIVGVGGDLEPESLLLAYRQGIFPWPMPEWPLAWFCPPKRGILEWENLHIPRSLTRAKNKNNFSFTIDQAFEQVISICAQMPRPGQLGTWITDDMKNAYIHLHRLKHAHSVEVWKEERLVGGMYGVDGGGVFAGESMFYLEPNASKLAILFLMEYLKSKNLDWIDIQMVTPHMEALGAREISRDRFLARLKATQNLGLKLF